MARRRRLGVPFRVRVTRVRRRVGCREGLGAGLVDGAARLADSASCAWVVPSAWVCSPSGKAARKVSRRSVRATRSWGRLGPAREGVTVPRSSESDSLKAAPARRRAEQTLRLRVRLDPLDDLVGAAGHAQVAQGLVVDREHRGGRAELGAHVADRGAIRQPQPREAGPVELHELADHAMGAKHLGHVQDEVGGGRAGRQLAVEAEADHDRHRLVERLAEQRRLGLDAADAPADDAQPVDHRGVRVGADQRVGQQDPVTLGATTSARNSRLTWWTMPVPGGTTRKSANACCAQRRSA